MRVLITARKRIVDDSKAKHLLRDLIVEYEIRGLEKTAALNLFYSTSATKVQIQTVYLATICFLSLAIAKFVDLLLKFIYSINQKYL